MVTQRERNEANEAASDQRTGEQQPARAAVPPFVISEQQGKKRTIRLTQRALPYRPISFGGEQRVQVTWLPGTPSGTATILGPTEAPTTIGGMWKRKYIDQFQVGQNAKPMVEMDGARVRFADLIPLIDELRRVGGLLRVEWATEIRFGYITRFFRDWSTTNDVEWEVVFEWVSLTETDGNPVLNARSTADDLLAGLKNSYNALAEIDTPEGVGLDFGFLEGIRDLQEGILAGINAVTDTVQQVTSKVISTIRSTRGLISTLIDIGATADLLIGYVEGQFGSEFTQWDAIVNDPTNPGPTPKLPVSSGGVSGLAYDQQTEILRLRMAVFKRQMVDWARTIRNESIERRTELERDVDGDIKTSVKIRENQSLQDLATIHYGSPFEWRRLAIFNGLRSPTVPVGTLVLIPKANPEEGGQACPGL